MESIGVGDAMVRIYRTTTAYNIFSHEYFPKSVKYANMILYHACKVLYFSDTNPIYVVTIMAGILIHEYPDIQMWQKSLGRLVQQSIVVCHQH